MKRALLPALILFAFVFPHAASARTVCTIVADARTGTILLEEGDCRSRVTPASTFKIPLAVMGYDARFLRDPQTPVLPFRAGYPNWGANWEQPTDPQSWMKHSVVWYSQEIARDLGVERLTSYAARFGYGNADFAGDLGKNNALERAWISSSLKISPVEQVGFLRNLLTGNLPVERRAVEQTLRIVESAQAGEWTVAGKTGSAYPRNADGSFNRARGWGWFVGWATRGDRALVFARLNQDEQRQTGPGGLRARAKFLDEWPALSEKMPE